VEEMAVASNNGMNVVFVDNEKAHDPSIRRDVDYQLSVLSRERTDVLLQKISDIVDAGGRIVVNTGYLHALNSSRITILTVEADGATSSIEAGPSLGYLLKQKYGDSQVLVVSLSACISSFLDVCLTDEFASLGAAGAPAEPRK
jgi:hypothetical protein